MKNIKIIKLKLQNMSHGKIFSHSFTSQIFQVRCLYSTYTIKTKIIYFWNHLRRRLFYIDRGHLLLYRVHRGII